jgi:SAM-dependent methyltransferase
MRGVGEAVRHWEAVYAAKGDGELSWHQGVPEVSLALIAASGVGERAAILDVGGGQGVLAAHLLARGYRDVSVLDLSGAALSRARARLGERAAEVTWIEADVTHFRPERRYDLWHDRATFHFLTDMGARAAYARALLAGLRPGGQLVLGAFAVGGPERCSGLPVRQYDAARLMGELGPAFTLLETRQETHLTPAGKPQAFAWFRLERAP